MPALASEEGVPSDGSEEVVEPQPESESQSGASDDESDQEQTTSAEEEAATDEPITEAEVETEVETTTDSDSAESETVQSDEAQATSSNDNNDQTSPDSDASQAGSETVNPDVTVGSESEVSNSVSVTPATANEGNSQDDTMQTATSTNEQTVSRYNNSEVATATSSSTTTTSSSSNTDTAAAVDYGATSTATTATSSASNQPADNFSAETANESVSEHVQPEVAITDSYDSQVDRTVSPATTTSQVAGAASTTDLVVPEPEFMNFTQEAVHSDSQYQFTKQQCIPVGGGGYHCFDAVTSADSSGAGQPVYASTDSDGDLEIYLQAKDKHIKVTDNTLDDAAPYYDQLSQSVVWHRLEGGRHSIYSYENGRELLLSGAYSNSMEPSRAGQYTVWQSWIDNNWEIVLFDGENGRVISNSLQPDIAPKIQGEYIIWNIVAADGPMVAVYEIKTGQLATLEADAGSRVENPRFVLVYDTKYDNGDIITKGFNAETGEVVPLGAQAPVMPVDIPSSDQTGETRALIQNKANNKEEVDELLIPINTSGSTPDPELESGTTTVSLASSTNEVLPLSDFDVIVEPYATSSAQVADSAQDAQQVE